MVDHLHAYVSDVQPERVGDSVAHERETCSLGLTLLWPSNAWGKPYGLHSSHRTSSFGDIRTVVLRSNIGRR